GDQTVVFQPRVADATLRAEEFGLVVHVIGFLGLLAIDLDGQGARFYVHLDDGALDLLILVAASGGAAQQGECQKGDNCQCWSRKHGSPPWRPRAIGKRGKHRRPGPPARAPAIVGTPPCLVKEKARGRE